ncbi:MAG: TonB-dependent receptor, partial [Bacteroidales bacterium]|nr:TonB-dependent receptor [Bacteroidales bacterium]
HPTYGKFISRVDTDGDLDLIQSFVQLKHKFNDTFSSYIGLHYQHLTLNNSIAVEPRAGIKWNFKENQSINLGLGMHSQLQPRNAYFTQYYDSITDSYYETNKELDFLRSKHLVLGYDNLLNTNLRFKAETYFQYINGAGVVEAIPEFSMLNAGDYFYIPVIDSLLNEGNGMNYGVEFTLEKFLSNNYYFLVTTSFFESKYTGYDEDWRNTAFNGNFVINALFGYERKVGDNSILAFNFRTIWAGGKRFVPIDLEESIESKSTEYFWEDSYQDRYEDYFKIDARISFKMNGKRINQEWALDIQNITNNQNMFNEAFDPISGEIKTEYQSGLYPMFLYRIQF